MGYNVAGRYCSCWNCGGHSLITVVRELTGWDYEQCREVVGGLPKLRTRREEHAGKLQLPDGIVPLTMLHQDYLRGRGFSPLAITKRWGVQGIGQIGGHLRWRLFIPVHLDGEVVSWTTRTIGRHIQPRYWSAKDEQSAVPIDRLVYGIDHVRVACVVCEGPIDAWAVGSGGVALLGQRDSPSRFELLSRVARRIICFDSDPDAQKRARRLADNLAVYGGETINVRLESGKDPASACKEEIACLRKMLE